MTLCMLKLTSWRFEPFAALSVKGRGVCALFCVYLVGLVSTPSVQAQGAGWIAVSGDGARQVRGESLRTTKPLVAYVLRYVDSAGVQSAAPFGVEVDCVQRERRELPLGRSSPPYTWQDRQELEYVCRWAMSHWNSGRVSVDASDPSWWSAPNGAVAEGSREKVVVPESPPLRVVPQPAQPKAAAPQLPQRSAPTIVTGSGFVVTAARVVTNQHVVRECEKLFVRQDANVVQASLVASNERTDLALLSTRVPIGNAVAIRATPSLGEDVTVAGYPLSGILSDDIIVTGGQVNSLAGIGNDPTILQISAPVQPGNSGGPLIDRAGAVVGVVVSKLNAERVSKVTGDMAQNVNFAIKPEVLRLFLDSNRVPYRGASLGQRLDGIQLAERARSYTVQVICEK
jgi:S1-C subfamily serine protease